MKYLLFYDRILKYIAFDHAKKSPYLCFKCLINLWRSSNDDGSSIANKIIFIAWAMQDKVSRILAKEVAISFLLVSSKDISTFSLIESFLFTVCLTFEIVPSLRIEISSVHAS